MKMTRFSGLIAGKLYLPRRLRRPLRCSVAESIMSMKTPKTPPVTASLQLVAQSLNPLHHNLPTY